MKCAIHAKWPVIIRSTILHGCTVIRLRDRLIYHIVHCGKQSNDKYITCVNR